MQMMMNFKHKPAHAVPVARSKRPPRPKPKGNGPPIRTRGPLANGRTAEGAGSRQAQAKEAATAQLM